MQEFFESFAQPVSPLLLLVSPPKILYNLFNKTKERETAKMKSKSIKKKKKKYKRKKTKHNYKILFLLLPVIIILFLLIYLFRDGAGTNPTIFKTSSTIPVIDVSKWEGDIDWYKVKSSGIRHAILKIGSGDYDGSGFNEDSSFETNYKNTVKEGFDCGVYFFSYAVTPDEARREALYCLELLEKYDIKPSDLFFPVAFDIEYDKALKTGKRNCTDMTLAFCETMEEAGYEPMIYSSASYLEHNLIYREIEDYKFWVANYEANGPAFGKPYAMWQYSEDGQVDGIKDFCDMNYWYTNYIEVEELKIKKDSLSLEAGSTSSLDVTILPRNATNKRVTFKSSNKNVVKIQDEQTGTVEAVKKGTAWITVQTPSGIKERIKIKVK